MYVKKLVEMALSKMNKIARAHMIFWNLTSRKRERERENIEIFNDHLDFCMQYLSTFTIDLKYLFELISLVLWRQPYYYGNIKMKKKKKSYIHKPSCHFQHFTKYRNIVTDVYDARVIWSYPGHYDTNRWIQQHFIKANKSKSRWKTKFFFIQTLV